MKLTNVCDALVVETLDWTIRMPVLKIIVLFTISAYVIIMRYDSQAAEVTLAVCQPTSKRHHVS